MNFTNNSTTTTKVIICRTLQASKSCCEFDIPPFIGGIFFMIGQILLLHQIPK